MLILSSDSELIFFSESGIFSNRSVCLCFRLPPFSDHKSCTCVPEQVSPSVSPATKLNSAFHKDSEFFQAQFMSPERLFGTASRNSLS